MVHKTTAKVSNERETFTSADLAGPYPGAMTRSAATATTIDKSTRPAVPTAVVAAGSLVTGFAVAQVTDVRAAGGVVLLAGAVWCGRHWVRRRGPGTASILLLGYAGAFVGSHLLAPHLGAWPAVLTVAAAVGVTSWVVADRRG